MAPPQDPADKQDNADPPEANNADPPEADNAKDEPQKVEEYAATGLDDALEMMNLVTAKTDKASVGQAAAGIESHPEASKRRFKAAFEAYKENTLPELKKERPGLRLQQYNEIMYKQFQKHPDNPFNQQTVSYNATQEEKTGILQRQKERTENRYRQQP
ncbi:carbohydrate-binding module family 1 protein [Tulasnella calospora MUT 4182]|uniref:Carbohydrate-binding module family 1 protein n=1 Tax=Tulasnella calospora MUT 4182 TaxID=1051891 RepID=A0A0C3Q7J2_9AGAM|nr:carbohydrate-binding module family 1 protein [Tulasnella calospora MUT 4182]